MLSAISSKWGIKIAPEAIEELSGTVDANDATGKSLAKYLLCCDFKQLDSTSFSSIEDHYPMVVQVGKSVDISRPIGPDDEEDAEDAGEERIKNSKQRGYRGGGGAKRMLRIIAFTVGAAQRVELLEFSPIVQLSSELTPGTKLLIKSPLKTVGGFHLLRSRDEIEVLGGRVDRLAKSYDMGKQAKESRGQQITTSSQGPPKFVSFFDRDRKIKPAKPDVSAIAPKVEPESHSVISRTIDSASTMRADKSLKKLDTDAFAMKQKGERKFDRRSRRREHDDLTEQYKPPSRSAPQLSAFARLEKCDSIVGAQLLADAAGESRPRSQREDRPSGKGKGKGARSNGGKGMKGNSRR